MHSVPTWGRVGVAIKLVASRACLYTIVSTVAKFFKMKCTSARLKSHKLSSAHLSRTLVFEKYVDLVLWISCEHNIAFEICVFESISAISTLFLVRQTLFCKISRSHSVLHSDSE